MRQARTVLPNYSADVFGVCSALYELGGMVVMHDASGCNSTYSTHDEPRWYDSDSMVFISALTEMQAILGEDDKVVQDMLAAIEQLHPKFAALAGTPIPMMTGCDLPAIAHEVEQASGIPCFGFQTNGMRSYLCGASEALQALAARIVEPTTHKRKNAVNILGATPLDFSLSGTIPSLQNYLREQGFDVISTWAMGSTLDDLRRAGQAQVNLVISGVGMKTAQLLLQRFGTPYVVAAPVGDLLCEQIVSLLRAAAQDGKNRMVFDSYCAPQEGSDYIIGESILSRSLAQAIYLECGKQFRVLSTLEALAELDGVLSCGDRTVMEEEEIQTVCRDARTVIADPLYQAILPQGCNFISLPHEAFSGRIGRKDIPDLTKLKATDLLGVQ